ncbi:hypothetical protein C2G38_2076482 [Gigaspora rosea]|uniref:Uncharacterized protein n=1 Tax=Gigaspora rosea TaxID=44941 RepID=A0A397VHZ3_9GLOM|nr:hypothetical protein C2G38_2076482 [Gigaspora rosea]
MYIDIIHIFELFVHIKKSYVLHKQNVLKVYILSYTKFSNCSTTLHLNNILHFTAHC